MRCSRKLGNEQGSVMVLVAILLVVLIGMAALAIDIGQMYIARQRAQNVCDAAALAGVRELADNIGNLNLAEVQANQAALACVGGNNEVLEAWQVEDFQVEFPTTVYDDAKNPITVDEGEAIRVRGSVNVDFGFARIFGFASKEIQASATAILDSVRNLKSDLLINIAVSSQIANSGIQFGEPWDMTLGSWQDGFLGPGNWQAVRLTDSDNGTSKFISRLSGDSDPVELSIGDFIGTETGAAVGEGEQSATYEGLIGKFGGSGKLVKEGRILKETDPRFEATDIYTGYNPDAWDNWCNSQDADGKYADTQRIVVMPVLKDTEDPVTGHKQVEVVGFAGFFINRVYDDTDGVHPKGEIEGFFLKGVVTSDGTIVWGTPEYGTIIDKPSLVLSVRLLA